MKYALLMMMMIVMMMFMMIHDGLGSDKESDGKWQWPMELLDERFSTV